MLYHLKERERGRGRGEGFAGVEGGEGVWYDVVSLSLMCGCLVTARLFVGKEGSSGLVTRRWGAGGRRGGRRETIGGYPLLLSSPLPVISSPRTLHHHRRPRYRAKSDDRNYDDLPPRWALTPTDIEFSISQRDHFILQEDKHISDSRNAPKPKQTIRLTISNMWSSSSLLFPI